jgi:hypothetical protein
MIQPKEVAMKDFTCLRTTTGRRTSLLRSITGFRRSARLAVIATFAGLLSAASPALAQVSLGTAESFAVLGGPRVACTNSVVTGTKFVRRDPSFSIFVATGNVGVVQSTAFANVGCTIAGNIHARNAFAVQAYNHFLLAYSALAAKPCTVVLTGTLAGRTLAPGVYCFPAAATLTGKLTLNGPSTGIWIFKTGAGRIGIGALTGTNFSVVMAGGGQAGNVYWRVANAVTMTDSMVQGNILAGQGTTITRGSLVGRALAKGAVTMTSTNVHGL